MAGEWIDRKIGALGRVVTGKTPSTADPANFGGPYPFITIPDLDGRVFISRTERTLSEKGAKTLRTSLLPAGSVMMSCIATVGRCGITTRPSFTNQQINSVIPNNGVDSRLLYYVFTQLGHELESAGGGGSVYTNVSKNRFSDIDIFIPKDIGEQRAIAHILGTLDDKIELNRRVNETLEAMAQALFKSWFVNFDPVRAKAEGRDPGLPQPLADLFPARLVDSQLGEIPEGWEVKSLDQLARFLNGLTLQKYPPADGRWLPVIKIAQLRAGNTIGADRASADLDAHYVINDGDIIFSWSGSLECVLWAGGPGALNQHLFKVTSANYPRWLYYLGVHVHLDDFRHIAAGKATTMGHIQRHHLSDARLAVPSSLLLVAMDAWISPIIESLWKRAVESRTLAALRDTLLPKLISGELRVDDAEKFIERAAP
jgi:type I restriction enzyme S subunit